MEELDQAYVAVGFLARTLQQAHRNEVSWQRALARALDKSTVHPSQPALPLDVMVMWWEMRLESDIDEMTNTRTIDTGADYPHWLSTQSDHAHSNTIVTLS
jgi:hypothetical protein